MNGTLTYVEGNDSLFVTNRTVGGPMRDVNTVHLDMRHLGDMRPELDPSTRKKIGTEKRYVQEIELREHEGTLPTIVGYAAVFNRETDLGYYIESIAPGAFADEIKNGADVRALVEHEPPPIGRTKNNTLKLSEDSKGLKVEIVPADTQRARDTIKLIRRGDVDGMSFAFNVVDEDMGRKDGRLFRRIKKVRLFEVSPVTFPAYVDTDVGLRSVMTWEETDHEAASRIASNERFRIVRMRLRLAEAVA